MSKPPTYTLTLRPLPQADDPRGVRRLRLLIKRLLRSDRMRVVRCEPSPSMEDEDR